MLDCIVCLSRCLRAISLPLYPLARSSIRPGRTPIIYGHHSYYRQRNYSYTAAVAAAKTGSHPSRNFINARRANGAQSRSTAVLKTEHESPIERKADRKTQLLLKRLPDPLKLAQHVRNTLSKRKKGDEEEMEALVRLASKSMDCTVGWNHLIDHKLTMGKVAAAMKTYNEMKKRGQKPDSHTFTVLLRGLANHAQYSHSVTRALSLYHSMDAPNSRVRAHIIHTNAVLKVCARANDMDALWGVASKIPERGAGAADATTYTTILNALRQNALTDPPEDFDEDEVAKRAQEAVLQGRRIWADIVGKWRSGDLVIDDILVCSMARLLLISSRPRDWKDVLSLMEQTTSLPQLASRLSSPAPAEITAPTSDGRSVVTHAEVEANDEFTPLPKRISGPQSDSNGQPIYVKPTNNIFSAILEACAKTGASRAAQEYWTLLTEPQTYGLEPDLDNLHCLLRVLRRARASGATLDFLQSDAIDHLKLTHSTFRIAMSTCARNAHSTHAFEDATQLVKLMEDHLDRDADPKVLNQFAELAEERKNSDEIISAVKHLESVAGYMKSILNYGVSANGHDIDNETRKEAILVLRKLYSLVDRLLLQDQLPKGEVERFQRLRSSLSLYIRWEVDKGNIPSGMAKSKAEHKSRRGDADNMGKRAPPKMLSGEELRA